MSKSRRRNSSGELDVFEAALYYSGEVQEANLIGIQRAVAESRRSVDTPGRETTELFQRLEKSDRQSKNKGERQPCPGAKLASSIRSFFNQVISKKKASEYPLEKQAKRSSRERCEKPTPSLPQQREALRDGRSAKSTDGYKRCMVNARAAAPPGEALIAKAGKWRGRTEEEEDGGVSDSSSDLFELESYAMGVCNSKSYLFTRSTWK